MRVVAAVVLPLLAALLTAWGSFAYGESADKGRISFGLPFSPSQDDDGPKYPAGLSLADSIPHRHTNVVLISRTGVCSAKTSRRFQYEIGGGGSFKATLLERDKKCQDHPVVAVLGLNTSAIRVVSPNDDYSPVSKELEMEARRLLKSAEEDSVWPVSASNPKVLRAGRIALLIFDFEFEPGFSGPLVLIVNNKALRLDGWCTGEHVFFSLKDKLHLAYTAPCCGCGEYFVYVYDLSGAMPEQVYANGRLSH